MKLKFGDEQSIKYRDNAAIKNIVDELIGKVKCPYCKAPADHTFHTDLQNGCIGWNFKCKPKCPNSIESVESGCYEMPICYTDLKGKFIKD